MKKYIVTNINIRHNGKVYSEGSEIELEEVPQSLEQFLEVPHKEQTDKEESKSKKETVK
jgi:hypothetical protein